MVINGANRPSDISPSTAFRVGVMSLLLSIVFWSGLISVAATTKESANCITTTIQSWKEFYHSEDVHRDLLITCIDGNMYTIRWMLYEGRVDAFKAVLAAESEVSICTGLVFRDVMEISVDGNMVIPFDTGHRALFQDSIGYACIGAFLDLCGIGLIIYGMKKGKEKPKYTLINPNFPSPQGRPERD